MPDKPTYRFLGSGGCFAWLLFLLSTTSGVAAINTPANPPGNGSSQLIPDQYIVVFRESLLVSDPRDARGRAREIGGWADEVDRKYGVRSHRRWSNGVKGLVATMSSSRADELRKDQRVQYVEQDRMVGAWASGPVAPAWHLDRIDQRNLPLDQQPFNKTATGAGVTAYVIDSGIRTDHEEFEARAVWGTNVVGDNLDEDCYGHGTHVAGVIGGKTHGVAPGASLVAIKVLNCQGQSPMSVVLSGIDWLLQDIASRSGPKVVNMSLGTEESTAYSKAVSEIVKAGVTVVVASGNADADACDYSPASAPEAITVGAVTVMDEKATYSNWGLCVDIFAPGTNVEAAGNISPTSMATRTGTSMASPQVAGAAARYLEKNPAASPAAVAEGIQAAATAQQLYGIEYGSPNRLLYVGPDDSYSLYVAKEGLGRVVSNAGIDCGAICSQTLAVPASIELKAEPAAGYGFIGWEGAQCANSTVCAFALTHTEYLKAKFKFIPGSAEVFPNQGVWPDGWETPASSSSLPWQIVNTPVTEGGFSVKSGSTGPNQQSVLQYANDFEKGTLSFDWTVSSIAWASAGLFDGVSFYVDDVLKLKRAGCIRWHPTCWSSATVDVPGGSHTFKWVYSKNSGYTGGMDAAWLDNVVLPPFKPKGNISMAGLHAAILPYARATQTGKTVTAFATLINGTGHDVTGCYLALPKQPSLPAGFTFQTSNSQNTLTGTPDSAVDIPKGLAQNFVFGVTPQGELSGADIPIIFDCAETSPAPSLVGVNTFMVSASQNAVPDMVAISATTSGDGIARIPYGPPASGFFTAAAINIGVAGEITAIVEPGENPLVARICQTNPKNGECLMPPFQRVSSQVGAGEVVTYSVFLRANRSIAFDPANHRVNLRLMYMNKVNGATSVAVMTSTQ